MNQVFSELHKIYGSRFTENLRGMKGCKIINTDVLIFFKNHGDALFIKCEPEINCILDFNSAIDFCISERIFSKKNYSEYIRRFQKEKKLHRTKEKENIMMN